MYGSHYKGRVISLNYKKITPFVIMTIAIFFLKIIVIGKNGYIRFAGDKANYI